MFPQSILFFPRSSKWATVRAKHIASHPHCVACNKQDALKATVQVHHIFPVQFVVTLGRPDLELDERNLMTLCENFGDGGFSNNHHLLFGHLGDFESLNINVKHDAKIVFKGLSEAQIRANEVWQNLNKNKPHSLDKMTQIEKDTLKKLMDKVFPFK